MTMSKIKCMIVDDERLGRELIATHLKQLDQFELVKMCASAIEASKYLNQHPVDLMFLDIEMPVLKGTDFYKNLKQKPQVIFTTAYRDYAIDGFDLEAVDYLLKPITFARFFKAIERFQLQHAAVEPPHSLEQVKPEFLFVRVDRKDVKIYLNDILFIQSLKDYVQIHTSSKTWVTKMTMTSFLEQLTDDFIRVHRSYTVNQTHVSAYTKHDIELGNIEIPIGDTFQNAVLKIFQMP